MSKKELNQNDKIKPDLIDTFEPDFIFSNKPLNRLKISNSDEAKNILNKAEKLSELKKKLIQLRIVI
jgi:DNA polymerase